MKRILSCILVLGVLVAGVGCKDNAVKSEKNKAVEKQKYEVADGGEITLPLTGFKNLNPLLDSSGSVYYFKRLLFEGLFKIEKNLDVSNSLAESYVISNEARSINIKLRSGVKWQDGKPFTAEDVKYTIDTIKQAASSSKYSDRIAPMFKAGGLYDMDKIKSVQVLSDAEIKLNFENSFADVAEFLTFPIIPEHAFDGLEAALELENYKPIGTGSYKLESMDILKEVKLVKNPDYWGTKPHISTVIGKVLADKALAQTAFEAGRLTLSSDIDLNWEKYGQNDKVDISTFPSNKYEFIGFNFKKELFKGEEGKKFRQAMFYAINREQILKNVYLGHGRLVNTPVNPASWLSVNNEELNKTRKYEFEKAQKLLMEIGFQDSDADGILEDKKGRDLSINLTTMPTNQYRINTANIVAENLQKLGIKVEKDYEDKADTYEKPEDYEEAVTNYQNRLASSDYDLGILGWEMAYMPDLSFAFHSRSPKQSNFINYSDKKMDQLLDSANKAQSKEEKKQRYQELQNYIVEEMPYLSLLYTDGAMISYKRIVGELSPSYLNVYNGIESWFVPKEFQIDVIEKPEK